MLESGKHMDPQSREILNTSLHGAWGGGGGGASLKLGKLTGVDGFSLSALHQNLKKKTWKGLLGEEVAF